MNWKKTLVAFILILLFVPTIVISYFYSFEIIKGIDSNIFNLYASNGTSTTNAYLNDEVFQNAIIANAINQVFEENEEQPQTTQEAYRILLNNKENANALLLQNDEYQKYMIDNGLDKNGFWSFAEKTGELDDNIIKAVIYIWLLVYVLIFYFFFKYRKGIYVTAFLIYILMATNDYSGGLCSYVLYHPFTNLISIMNIEAISLSDYSMMFTSLLPALKEAILTYILLDTVHQISVEKKHRKNIFLIRQVLCSLKIAQRTLLQSQGGDFRITKLCVQFYPVTRIISRKQKKDSNSNELCNLITMLQDCKFPYKRNELLPIISNAICLMEQNKYLVEFIKY